MANQISAKVPDYVIRTIKKMIADTDFGIDNIGLYIAVAVKRMKDLDFDSVDLKNQKEVNKFLEEILFDIDELQDNGDISEDARKFPKRGKK